MNEPIDDDQGRSVGSPLAWGIEDLLQQIKDTADKLLRDRASRSDVKLLAVMLRELRYGFKVFAPFRERRKVFLGGSGHADAGEVIYHQAVELGQVLGKANYMIITGGGLGLMEAGQTGAGRENCFGIDVLQPSGQISIGSALAGDNKVMFMKYFFSSKVLFASQTHAFAFFPGGFGTQDEVFEVLALLQTGKSEMVPIVMIDEPGGNYWRMWQQYFIDMAYQRDFITREDAALYKITDSVHEAVKEIVTFYRVYHSMSFVAGDLYFRLQKQLPDAVIDRIRSEYADILVKGSFEQVSAHPIDAAREPHLRSLPRLRFRFGHRSYGRLRMLINLINQG